MKGICNSTIFWVPAPWGGAKRSNIIKTELQSQFQRFLNQTLLFTNERYIKYQTGFSLAAWVMPRGGTLAYHGGLGGKKKKFSKFNQIWCASYLHELHMHQHNFLGLQPLGPWRGVKNFIF